MKIPTPFCRTQSAYDSHHSRKNAANASKVSSGLATQSSYNIQQRNSHTDLVMDFLVPQAPALRQSHPSSMARKNGSGGHGGGGGGGVYLIGSTVDLKENFQQMQAQNKMTKKQLKMAQAQLDKLSQINIHLHGMFPFFI